MTDAVLDPFVEDDLEEIPLAASPLETVIFQIQFPGSLSKLKQALATETLQTLLADSFPYAEKQRGLSWTFQPGQPPTQEPGAEFWNLSSADRSVTASFGGESVSVTTRSYVSRDHFLKLISKVLAAVREAGSPPGVSRIGVRYIDRVLLNEAGAHEWTSTLSVPSRGVLAVIKDADSECVTLSIQQIVYKWRDGPQLQGRWGLLPKGAIIDPNMKVHDVETWFLDIDTFIEDATGGLGFEEAEAQLVALTQRAYRFFRWMVPAPALKRFRPGSSLS